MDVQGLQMTQNTPAPGVFKRNPPIAGEAEAIEAAKNGDAEHSPSSTPSTNAASTPSASACSATSPKPKT